MARDMTPLDTPHEEEGAVSKDHAFGAVTGLITAIWTSPKLKLALRDTLFGTTVYCYLDETQQEAAREFWGKRVSVVGLISRDLHSGRPTFVRKVESIELLQDAPTGSYKQAKGAIPWQQGDEPAEATIRCLRDAVERYFMLTLKHLSTRAAVPCLLLTVLLAPRSCGGVTVPPPPTPGIGLVKTLTSHSLWVSSIAWSPDGKLIASGSGDTSLRIWDVASAKEVGSLKFERGSVTSVTWSPDGKYLATGHAEPSGTIRIWEIASLMKGANNANPKPVQTMNPTGFVKRLAWSRAGSRLAVGLGFVNPNPRAGVIESGVAVFEAATGKPVAMLPYPDDVIDIAWSPDDKHLAFRAVDSNITLQDPASKGHVVVWTPVASSTLVTLGDIGGASDLDWSPDGKLLAAGNEKELKLLDTSTWKEAATMFKHDDGVGHVRWSPDGKSLATGGSPTVEIWDVQGRKLTHTFPHFDAVNSIAWSPNSKFLATGSEDHNIRIWEVK